MTYLIIATITGAALVTGLLFAFSNFVMRALADVPSDNGMEVMQRINVRIINPVFFLLFFGTPILCLIVGVNSALTLDGSGDYLLIAGSVLYLLGPFGVTLLFNVPLNNRLAETKTTDAEQEWNDYQVRWQRWNHLRTYIGVVSIILLSAGLAGFDQ